MKMRQFLGRTLALTALLTLALACGEDSTTGNETPTPPPTQEPTEQTIEIEQTSTDLWDDIEISVSMEGVEAYYAGVVAKADYLNDNVLSAVASGDLKTYTQTSYQGSITAFPEKNDIEVEPETTYVVWVVPVKDSYYSSSDIVKQEVTSSADLRKAEIEITTLSSTFNNVEIRVEMTSVKSYYAGYELTNNLLVDDILLLANNDGYNAYTSTSYQGLLTNFPTTTIDTLLPDTSYTIWVLPVPTSGEATAEDLVTYEVKTDALTSGGSVQITEGPTAFTPTRVEVTLLAEGATLLYYDFVTMEELKQVGSGDTALREWLFAKGESAVISTGTFVASVDGLPDDTQVALMALAVDAEGRYGKIFYSLYRTEKLPFNEMIVTINEQSAVVTENSLEVSWSVEGGSAVGYLCFLGRTEYTYWNSILGGTVESAQAYMSLNPEEEGLITSKTASLTNNELRPGAEYILLVMALDGEGYYSMADSYTFTTQGTAQKFIPRYLEDGSQNPAWSKYGLPTVTFGDCFIRQFYRIIWKTTPAEGTTAYSTPGKAEYIQTYYNSPLEWAEKVMLGGEDLGDIYLSEKDGSNNRISAGTQVTDPDQYWIYPYGESSYKVYVTWTDSEGNLYEACSFDLPVIEQTE